MERCNAERMVIVAPDEWAQGFVRVKNLASREEANVTVEQLLAGQISTEENGAPPPS